MTDKQDLRIVYMGTPEFAVAPLAALVEGGYNVVGVVTAPDKPAGRGHRLQSPPVKVYAEAHAIPVLQPVRLKDEAFLAALAAWHADLQVVVAFRMLPEAVWAMPSMGTFNLHAALLPQYRGAAPIHWAVINGERETGVTTFFIDRDIDTGRIIRQERIPIAPADTAGGVHDRLMAVGSRLVARTVDLVLAADGDPRRIPAVDQSVLLAAAGILRPAPKIFKDDCRIDWRDTAQHVCDKVRGLCPAPAAWTTLVAPGCEPVVVKVFGAQNIPAHSAEPVKNAGEILSDGKTFLHVNCADGVAALTEIQLPGKRRMPIRDALNGWRIPAAARME